MTDLKQEQVNSNELSKDDIVELKRIQKALFVLRNLFCSLDECELIWLYYSSNLCASWLFVPDSFELIVDHIEGDRSFISYQNSIEEARHL